MVCALPEEMKALMTYLNSQVPGIEGVSTSVHCHNDLGLATANSLAGLDASIDQIECTVNGIGERAGNAALEEVVMAIKTRETYWGCETAIRLDSLLPLSRWVETHGGLVVQANKAVVGKNAFSHESGVHVDGMVKCEKTYEYIDRHLLGVNEYSLVLGRQSGRKSLKAYLNAMGVTLTASQFALAFELFEQLADTQSVVSQCDIDRIVQSIGFSS